MAFTHLIKSRSQAKNTDETAQQGRKSDQKLRPIAHDSQGVALFIVMAAISVLAILVTEFTYVSQVTQAVAFGSLDQVKAHYLAKSAFKLSLLRLKAYQQVKKYVAGLGASVPVPRTMIDMIWSFPFSYPIPTGIPGLSQTDKEAIDKFQKSSGFEGGSYRTRIESESSKYNLNRLLANYAPPTPVASTTPVQPPLPGSPLPTPSPTPVGFNQEAARTGLYTYLDGLLTSKIQTDTEFADNRRNFRLQDLVDNISSWADRSYDRRSSTPGDLKIPFKKAPFYTISELHMIPAMDDELYNLFSPTLTTSFTIGLNVNTMQEPVLRAIIPRITPEEVTDFFKFRDSQDSDNKFKDEESFYKYLQRGIVAFTQNPQAFTRFKDDLAKANIKPIFDENQFKITVEARVNNSYRTIEAWVELPTETAKKTVPGTPPNPSTPGTPPSIGPGGRNIPDPGLKITFMKII